MTDAYYASSAINGLGLSSAALPDGHTFHRSPHYAIAVQDAEQEDDGQISCLCGFDHDDGNTVACDDCNRWQHIDCYYPHLEGPLPEQLQHYCLDCKPRRFDHGDARELQQRRREQQVSSVNGARRPTSKSHKKKVKAEATPAHTNGWPLDKTRHDRNSASPRDQQPPPAKRPKTSHRASDATANPSTKGHSRKRNASNVNGARSLTRSPEPPIPLYTPEFLQAYGQDNWSVTDANLHNGISVTNELTDWLRKPDDLFRSMHNVDKGEVLMRWDGELNDIPGKAQLEIRDMHDESVLIEHQHPAWKIVTVQEPVASGGYIGELKGHVGFRDQYLQDPTNRWSSLRHPEPFVFFHPKLPVYIDARSEGTDLRYVRRSCTPNARLQILVTEGTDYRFCFMATALIEPGQEVSVAWDTADAVPGKQNLNTMSPSEMGQFRTWASIVMANCGPCACSLPTGHTCGFAQLDRRGMNVPGDDEQRPGKAAKLKRRKVGQHVSPIDTTTQHSRSGSEARRGDLDDEPTDSVSGSGGRGTASRDLTPNTHYSNSGSGSMPTTMPELSERERKKLAKEEEMFRRQEEERTGKQSKKKRSSGGSTVNTPSTASFKPPQFSSGPKHADAGTSRPSDLPSAKSMSSKRTTGKNHEKRAKTVTRPKPTYVDSAVQCDLDEEDAVRSASMVATPRPKVRVISLTQRLLDRCARNNAILAGKTTTSHETAMDLDIVPKVERQASNAMTAPTSTTTDVDMEDVPAEENASGTERLVDTHMTMNEEAPSAARSHPSTESTDSSEPTPPSTDTSEVSVKVKDMHIDMPPPPLTTFITVSEPDASDASAANGITVQSPASLVTPALHSLPSSVKDAVMTPARKKLSLSDYTKRNKTKDKDSDTKTERDSSPASTASGPVLSQLHHSSSDAVATAKLADGGSAIVEDDPPAPSVAA
nr:set domain-containing protein 3 [Quercus suber]